MEMAGIQMSCENDPNFGIILSFMERFGSLLDIGELNIADLKAMLENSETVPQALADLHIKLMRKINKKVPAARWELALAKFAHSYSHQDAWEIERFGYKTANLGVKLRVLKVLLEGQFDLNTKFKTQINSTGARELQLDPLGRDRQGNCYWYFMDESANLQIYQSDAEMETWTLVASNRDEFVNMIEMLKENRPIEPLPTSNAVDEEDDSAGSASESEAMKLGTILTPSEAPPSLIISRRTYKSTDRAAPAAGEQEVGGVENSIQPEAKAVEDHDVEMKDPPPIVMDSSVSDETAGVHRKDVSVENNEDATEHSPKLKTETVAAKLLDCEMTNVGKVLPPGTKRELNSKDEVVSTEIGPIEETSRAEEAEESNTADKCIIKEVIKEDGAEQSEASGEEKGKNEKTLSITEQSITDRKEVDEQKKIPEPQKDATVQPAGGKSLNVTGALREESLPERDEKKTDVTVESSAEGENVSEAIDDPLLVVQEEGSGADCDSGIEPMFSEVIVEPIIVFYGAGAGVENDMGNTKKVESALTATESANSKELKFLSQGGSPPVSSKTGNGERKPSPKGTADVDSTKCDWVEKKAQPEVAEEAENNDDGGKHGKTPSKRELPTKENDGIEPENQQLDDEECEEENKDNEGVGLEPSKRKRSRKPVANPFNVVVIPRGKRSEKSADDTATQEATTSVAELPQEKPTEKRRGSRKNSTPKKSIDSITASPVLESTTLLEESETATINVKLKNESDEENRDGPHGETEISSIKMEENGDHQQLLQSLSTEGQSSGVKEELKKEQKDVDIKAESDTAHRKGSDADIKEPPAVTLPEVKVHSGGDDKPSITPREAIEVERKEAMEAKLPSKDEQIDEPGKATEGVSGEAQLDGESPTKRKRRQRNGLVDGLDISMVLDAGSDGGNNPPVRQSRRIAMQKIKEETNRRQIEDEMLKKMKADAVKKKKDLGMQISDDEYRRTSTPDQSDSSSSDGGMGADGRRRKKKKKKKKGTYQQQLQQQQQLQAQLAKKQTTWNSATSPESSSETEADDYFAEPYHSEEDVRRNNVLKSDHEFSPESDLETEVPAQPLKRARTARKARRTRDEEREEEEEEVSDDGEDHACQQCKKTDQPEWILLCDSCDKGYHCACLKPVLFSIPEGDWFCPVCQHRQLIDRLQSKLEVYDALQTKLEAEAKRRQEEEQTAREAELAEQALEKEREEELRAQKRARQEQRLLERRGGGGGGNGRRSRSGSGTIDSSRDESQRQKRRRRQRHRNRMASKRRRSSRSRSRDGSQSSASGESGDGSGSGSSSASNSGSGSASCTDSDDMPIYKHLRRRASTKVSYKFNEYDNLIDSAIRREMRDCEVMVEEMGEQDENEDDEGHGFSMGKDISTIIEATTREEQARKKTLQKERGEEEDDEDRSVAREGDNDDCRLNGSFLVPTENCAEGPSPNGEGNEEEKEGKDGVEGEVARQDRRKLAANNKGATVAQKKGRKKKKKLCKIELSSEEEEDDSDEDFRGDVSGSEDEEEEDDEDDEDENSISGDSESSLDLGRRGRNNRQRKPSSRAAVSKRRRILENSDDSEDEEEERRRIKAMKNRKNRRVLDDSDEELDLDDDDEEEDSEDYDSDDLCSDTETESSRSSNSDDSSNSTSSSSASTEGDWRRKKKKKKKSKGGTGGKTKPKSASAGGGGLGSGKHLERPKKTSSSAARPKPVESSGEDDSGDSDSAGKGGKTMPRKPSKKSTSRSSRSPDSGKGGPGDKKTDRKTRGKKIHYIVDDDFESSDDGIRPGVQRPDTPPEEREQFIRRQEEIKRMLAENNAAKAKELATSRIDQLVGGRSGVGSKEPGKDSLSDVPMQVIESARILDIDFLKSTSGNTARISTVDSVVDFDDELPEDFDPDDEMDDEALAKIMEEEDFAHHQLKPPVGVASSIATAADLLPTVGVHVGAPSIKTNQRRSAPDANEALLQQRGRSADPAGQGRKDQPTPVPINLVASAPLPPHAQQHAAVQSPIKALLKPTSIPTSTIMPPIGTGPGGTILANALQTSGHVHHAATLPPPPLVKEPHPGGGRPDALMRGLAGPPHPGSLHHKPAELSHLMAGLGGGVPLALAKGGGGGVPLPHSYHSSHRLPPGGLGMPPTMLGHSLPPHALHLGLHAKLSAGVSSPGAGGNSASHSAAAVAAAVAAASTAAAAAIGANAASAPVPGPGSVPGMLQTPPTAPSNIGAAATPMMTIGPPPLGIAASAERRPGRRKKITPLREDLKRKGGPAAPAGGEHSTVPSAAHQEQHQRPPPQHASQHHGHMGRMPPGGPPAASTTAPPVGLRPPLPSAISSHNSAHQSATAIAGAAASAAAQDLAIKIHSRPGDGGVGPGGPGMLVTEPPLSVPSSVAHLSYLSENPLFAHRLGPLTSSILSSGSSSLQRIAAISGAGPPAVYGDPAAYNGGWKPTPSSNKLKSSGGPQQPHPSGMMVGPSIGSLEHYHEYNPANHFSPYYNVLDRAHLRAPPTIGELHRTSTLSPTTFTTLQPLEFQHVLKPSSDNHHHHHSAASSPASTAGEDVGVGRGSAGSGERLAPPHGSGVTGLPAQPAAPPSESHPSVAVAASPPPSVSAAATVAASAQAAVAAAAVSTVVSTSSTSTSVFGELVSYFSSQQDDLDS